MEKRRIASGVVVAGVVGAFYAGIAGVPNIQFTGVFDVGQIVNTYPKATALAGSVTVLALARHWFDF